MYQRDKWPARWVSIDPLPDAPCIMAYRCAFGLSKPTTFGMHVTADERHDLYLNGELIGRGPERGDAMNWFYQSYQLSLPAGTHVLVAIAQRLGAISVKVRRAGGGLHGQIDLPAGLSGELVLGERRLPLTSGRTTF